jgi:hypothetical protein
MSKVQLQGNASGTGIFTIASPNSNTDRTLTLPDNTGTVITTGSTAGVSQAMLASGVAGNGPSFRAYQATVQNISSGTATKYICDVEVWDTASCYNPVTGRFTPNVAGYYLIMASLGWSGLGNTNTNIYIAKNSVNFSNPVTTSNYYNTLRLFNASGAQNIILQSQLIIYFNGSTDYIEVYIDQSTGSTVATANSTTGESDRCWFEGALIRAV